MLSVDIEKIIPVTEARDMFNKIIDEVEGSDDLYVLTKNGKPSAVVVGINHLEKLTGETDTEVMAKVDQAGPKEAADDDFSTSDQFNTKDATPPAVNQTPVADQTPAEPVPPAQTPAIDPAAKTEPVKDDVSFGDLPPNNTENGSAGAATDPFTPPSSPTPAEKTQTNPPGSSGGLGQNPVIPPPPGDDKNLSSDPMAPATDADGNTDMSQNTYAAPPTNPPSNPPIGQV